MWNHLVTIKMKKDLANYQVTFDEVVSNYLETLDLPILDQIFMNGLSELIKKQWALILNKPENLDKKMILLKEIKSNMKDRQDIGTSQNAHWNQLDVESNPGDPMDLNTITAQPIPPKKSSPAWQAWCKKHRACFNCGNKNHISVKCDQRRRTDSNDRKLDQSKNKTS